MSIKGPGDDKTDYIAGVNFIFERMDPGIWGFGITVDDEEIILENGETITEASNKTIREIIDLHL